MGTYVFTVTTKTVPNVDVNGLPIYTSKYAGKPSYDDKYNGGITRRCAFAETIHSRNGSNPKYFTLTEFSELKKNSPVPVYFYESGLTCFDDTTLGLFPERNIYPQCVGDLVREGKSYRFVRR